jgi:hypothetical protein
MMAEQDMPQLRENYSVAKGTGQIYPVIAVQLVGCE